MQDRSDAPRHALETLLDSVTDPRRLGGHARAIRIVGRTLGREITTFGELEHLLASLSEGEVSSLLMSLRIRMPDLTTNTIFSIALRLPKAA